MASNSSGLGKQTGTTIVPAVKSAHRATKVPKAMLSAPAKQAKSNLFQNWNSMPI